MQMKNNLPYDDSDFKSILQYASLLTDKSLSIVLKENISDSTLKGKGSFGQKIEKLYFGYEPNSNPQPDFPKAGLELKTAPLKKTSKGLTSKERLVFNIIDYEKEHTQSFTTSSFWKKNQLLLLMFYLHEQEKLDIDYIFKIIRLWQFPATDLKIIKDDWTNIILKIKAGKAHEISEGDTFYLGACTKGANHMSLRSQPFSSEKAMQRAFSLKSKYLNFIISKSLANEEVIIDYEEYDKILNEDNLLNEPRAQYRKINFAELEPIVKSLSEYGNGETFEDLVVKKFTPFIGHSIDEIIANLEIEKPKAKNMLNIIAKSIMGVQSKKIEEFEKADVLMKTIKLEKSGSLKESMSFSQIQYKKIINEEWEDSYWYNTLTKRFFFVIFKKNNQNILTLKKVMFWTFPFKDLAIAKKFWEDTKQKILMNNFESFIKISDDMICHIRPKGLNKLDLMETASGNMEKKKCYWINSSYIKEIIE